MVTKFTGMEQRKNIPEIGVHNETKTESIISLHWEERSKSEFM